MKSVILLHFANQTSLLPATSPLLDSINYIYYLSQGAKVSYEDNKTKKKNPKLIISDSMF